MKWMVDITCIVSNSYVGIKQVVFGGSEFENWRENLTSEDAGFSVHKIWAATLLPCTISDISQPSEEMNWVPDDRLKMVSWIWDCFWRIYFSWTRWMHVKVEKQVNLMNRLSWQLICVPHSYWWITGNIPSEFQRGMMGARWQKLEATNWKLYFNNFS